MLPVERRRWRQPAPEAVKLHRRLLRNPPVREAVAAILTGYVRLVYRTTRWTRQGDDSLDLLVAEGVPIILCYWHGRLLMLAPGWRYPDRTHLLVSSHADGDLIASVVGRLGFGTVRGSSRRGGASAFRQMLRLLATGAMIGITPDGPRGPRMRAGSGAVMLARAAGAALVPVAYATAARHVASSWDRFVVPRPFSRGAYLIGAPLRIARDADADEVEAMRRQLEGSLTSLTAEADRLCGQRPMVPAAEIPTSGERAAAARAAE